MNKLFLIELIKKLALEVKPPGQFFTLKNGDKSSYYLDCRNLILSTEGLPCVADALLLFFEFELGMDFDAFGGVCIGADPIIGALCLKFAEKHPMRAFLVRPTAKDHGKGGRIIGPLRKGDKCVLIEDVVTTGSSCLDAVDAIEEFGAKVTHILSIVDRQQGGAEAIAKRNIVYQSLVTIQEILK